MKPMLALNSNPKKVQSFIDNDDWWFQQKLDGIRILITVEDGVVSGVGRSGRKVILPEEAITPFEDLEGLWRFDGEFLGIGGVGALHLFDMPNAGDIVKPGDTYEKRSTALAVTYNLLFPEGSEDIKLVPISRTREEKQELLDWCLSNQAEGVMMKDMRAGYLPNSRSPFTLKNKFTETIDCMILEVGREGKQSVAVGAYHEGSTEPLDIGSVKMTSKQGLDIAKKDDVITVRYLYVDKKLRLVQPVFLEFRSDKDPSECNTEQLKYTDKTVRN